ncbi:hypothetical protein FSP39_008400 [Pinctada imbricata]|uniref:SH3 domain-containing protein n=1 Tax=Pinctada imbricata TaxID=66713 RepID=A0AA88YB41_PINIB|nr:hypothetical protein FSP39_008400 [Pinctada imbricata]
MTDPLTSRRGLVTWTNSMFSVVESYEPSRKGELKLNIGDKVDKVKDIGNGWVIGRNVNSREKGSFPEYCIDRNTSITGAVVRRFTTRYRSVKPTKDPKINVIESDFPRIDENEVPESGDIDTGRKSITDDPCEDDDIELIDDDNSNDEQNKDGTHKFYILRLAILRILTAVVASAIVYLLLVFSFSFDFAIAGYIVTGVFVFVILGVTFSAFIRCVLLIMVPNMVTRRGKAIILSVITALLLSGPATNISHNTEEVGQSLGCTTELIYNQTQALRKQLEEPIKALKQKIYEYMKSLEEFSAIKTSVQKVRELATRCEADLRQAANECHRGNDKTKQDCIKAIDRVDPTSKLEDFGNKVKDAFRGWRKRRSYRVQPLSSTTNVRHLVKRGVLSNICKIFDAGTGVCNLVGSFGNVCSPIKWLSNTMGNVVDSIMSGLNKVVEFFDYKVKNELDLSGSAKSSKNASTIVDEIKDDLLSKTVLIRSVFSVFNRTLSISLLILVLSSLLYLKKYRTKLAYDNKYITEEFIQYDEECKRSGMESVLPLTKKEAKKYMFTSSMKLSMAEISRLKRSAVFMVYHVIITLIIISFDYILYYVLLLIQDSADVALIVEGENTLDVEVEGSGVISNFVRRMVSSLNLDTTYNVQFNFTTCLPNPRHPDYSRTVLIASIYFLAIIFLMMETYGLRLRRKIASSFYPKQEQNRVLHLHEKIIQDRIAFAGLLKDRVFRRRKEDEVRGRITANGYVSGKASCMSRCCDCFLPEKRSCHGCDLTARRGRLFVRCQNEACNAVFCKECFILMEGTCFVCDKKQEDYDMTYDTDMNEHVV